ncbi:MAG: hypothetical protein R2875_05175 [Desulfobacterales bacterium]
MCSKVSSKVVLNTLKRGKPHLCWVAMAIKGIPQAQVGMEDVAIGRRPWCPLPGHTTGKNRHSVTSL